MRNIMSGFGPSDSSSGTGGTDRERPARKPPRKIKRFWDHVKRGLQNEGVQLGYKGSLIAFLFSLAISWITGIAPALLLPGPVLVLIFTVCNHYLAVREV